MMTLLILLKLVLFTPLLLAQSTLSSKTYFFLIDPGTNARSNYYRFYNSLRMGYEVLKKHDKNVFILAKNGHWILAKERDETLSNYSLTGNQGKSIPLYPPIASSAYNLDDVFSFIKKQNIKDGDKVFLFITPHGVAPSDPKDPSTVKIPFWSRNDSYGYFLEKLKKDFSSKIIFFIVTTACYGGAVHILATLPNVCTLSTVPFDTLSSAGNYQIHTFSKAFWKSMLYSLDRPTQIPLTLGYLAQQALSKDMGNIFLGRISSSHYVDEILSSQTSTKSTSATWVKKLEKDIWQRESVRPEHHFFSQNSLLRKLGDDIFYPEKFSNSKICINDNFTNIKTQIANIENSFKTIFINPHFQSSMDYIKKASPDILKTVSFYFQEHDKYLKKWEKYSRPKENTSKLRTLTKAWKKLNNDAKKDLIELNYHLGMMQYAKKIIELKQKVSAKEWAEYQRRLECEWTSFF